MRLIFIMIFGLLTAQVAVAQSNDSIANATFTNAVRIYIESRDKDGATRKQAATEVLRLLDLIVIAYPDSIPGKRIKAGGKIGPINLDELRALAGEASGAQPAPADQIEATPLPAPAQPVAPVEIAAPEPEKPPSWNQRVVLSSYLGDGLQHGQFPSIGQRTHAGVDITAACGQLVTAPWDGTIELLVKAGDDAFPKTGNAIVLRHDGRWNPAVYTAYFDLGAAPAVDGGDVAKGQVIGVTGPLPGSDECGVHFEVRNFSGERGPIYPLWHNVLGVGDWSADADFKNDWRDPVAWATQLTGIENGKDRAAQLLAQADWVRVYRPGLLARFNLRQRRGLSGQHLDQGLLFSGNLWARRVPGGLEISTTNIDASPNYAATKSQVGKGDNFGLSLRASLFRRGEPEVPVYQQSVRTDMRFMLGRLTKPRDSTSLVVPVADLLSGDYIRVDFVADFVVDDGRSFRLGTDFPLDGVPPDGVGGAEILLATRLADTVKSCVRWRLGEGASITYALSAASDGGLKIKDLRSVDYSGVSQVRVVSVTKGMIRNLRDCSQLRLLGYTSSNVGWQALEMKFGGTGE